MKFYSAPTAVLFALLTGSAFCQSDNFGLQRRQRGGGALSLPSNVRASQVSHGGHGPSQYQRRNLDDGDFLDTLIERQLEIPSSVRASQGSRGDYGPRRYRRRALADEDIFDMLIARQLKVPSNSQASQGSRGRYGPSPYGRRDLEDLTLETREADPELFFEDAEN